MNESIGGALLTSIVVTVVGIIIVIFAVSFAYNKAYKARTIILNAIEDNGEYDENSLNSIISEKLHALGYNQSRSTCANKKGRTNTIHTGGGYCIYEVTETKTDNMGIDYRYYEIETYLRFDIPLFKIEIPIYGQSKPYKIE